MGKIRITTDKVITDKLNRKIYQKPAPSYRKSSAKSIGCLRDLPPITAAQEMLQKAFRTVVRAIISEARLQDGVVLALLQRVTEKT